MDRRSALTIVTSDACPEEAAAVIAAIEQFLRDTVPAPAPAVEPRPSLWKRAALDEGVARQPDLWP